MNRHKSGTYRAVFRIGLLLTLAAFPGTTVLALDPQKAITQYVHDVWQAENGLPQNSVHCIAQTLDGYLWFGTQEGLVRFDGVRFVVFDKSNTEAIKNNYISMLSAGRDGSLWILTGGGRVVKLKDREFTILDNTNGLSGEDVKAICQDNDGNIWFATENGLNQLRAGKFTLYSVKDWKPSSNGALYGDHQGNLWFYSDKGLSKLREGKLTTYDIRDGTSVPPVTSIHEDHEGSLWICTFGYGLKRFKDGKFTTYTIKDGLSSNKLWSTYEDRAGNLWIATHGGGLDRFKDGKFSAYTMKEGLSSDLVRSIFEDREGSLWVGTLSGGMNRFSDGKFTTYTTQEGLSFNLISSIYQDQADSLLIGTYGGGLDQLKEGHFSNIGSRERLSEVLVGAICTTHDGTIWIGTEEGGLSSFKDGKLTVFTTKNGLLANSVLAIYEDRENDLWIGTTNGVNRLRDGQLTSIKELDTAVGAIDQDEEGSLWFGANAKLYRLKDGKFTIFTKKDGLSPNAVRAFYEDRKGFLWIGTQGGGLNRFKDGKFTAYTSKNGLFDDAVFTVLEDGHDNLWMTSNKGIFSVSKRALNEFAEGQITSFSSVSYTTADGLRGNECTGRFQPSGWKTKDGTLWFATLKGLVAVDPANIKINTLPPPVVIEQAIIDKKPTDLKEGASIPSGTRELEFHYTALSLVFPEKVKFKYKLEGFDKEWVDAGSRRVAYYTNLSPGRYRFRVMACNNDGVWNETGASVNFYLQPLFYQTRWFDALCGLVVILLGFGLYRLRVKQLRRRTQELEKTVEQRTGELKREQQKVLQLEKQATQQQMAGGFAHEMRNALAGSKLVLDQALAPGGPGDQGSLSLANCRGLKEIYLGVKDRLPHDDAQVVLSKMQTIFINEERLDEVMQLVRKATSRGLNITQQIMDYSKIGQQQPGEESINLNQLIESIINESRAEFLSQGVDLEHKADGRTSRLAGDETHFYSIIKNLIINARDALIEPSLADRNDRRIQISNAEQLGACTITIEDNGVGIPRESLEKIFEPFFSTKPASGTGLGLGMVRNMVSLYSGSIEVSSEVGKGTRFTITLPLARPANTLLNLSR